MVQSRLIKRCQQIITWNGSAMRSGKQQDNELLQESPGRTLDGESS